MTRHTRHTKRGAQRNQRPIRRRGQAARRRRRHALTAFCVALALIMLALSIYVGWWYLNRGRIRADSARYAQLYGGRQSAEPSIEPAAAMSPTATATVTAAPTPEPTVEPTPTIAPTPTVAPTVTPTPELTPEPTPQVTPSPAQEATLTAAQEAPPVPTATASVTPTPTPAPKATATPAPTPAVTPVPTDIPTPTPSPAPTAVPFGADMPIVEDEPIPTPGADTKVYALPTAPPVQPSFDALLALNPETVGFLEIEDMLALPVAQRENDNEYYLSHTFEGADGNEGALFMDGMNRLVPEDDCLIVYGHNMKNDTMFGKLDLYEDVSWLRRHPVVRFDTIYENRSYVAFAAFTASMQPGDRRFFDVRKFIFDEAEFDKFVLKLQSRSLYKVPVDVRYGDRLLLLVTCDYTNREGRFILALRQLRADETEGDAWALAMGATTK